MLLAAVAAGATLPTHVDGVNALSYIAGGLALNHQLNAPRVSHDIDVFNEGHLGGAWPQIVQR